ncbi:MAG: hypothetical protein JXR91_04795 [Deltaproteobacteria bacterium]|nr:hypothetical protein [Deltaproteobacteria bacterium]
MNYNNVKHQLIKTDVKWFVFFIFVAYLFLIPVSSYAGELLFSPAMATTPPKGVWAVEADLGIGQIWSKYTREDGSTKRYSDFDFDFISVLLPSLQVGISDRLHLGILNPGIAYRFGERGASEWVPFLDLGMGMGYSTLRGFILQFSPRVGLTARHWISENAAITWTLYGVSFIGYNSGGKCNEFTDPAYCEEQSSIFEHGGFGLDAGALFYFNKRFSFAPGVGIGFGWNHEEVQISNPTVYLLGASANGLWDTPLIRFHFNKYAALGLNAGAFLNTNIFTFGWDVGVNILVTW